MKNSLEKRVSKLKIDTSEIKTLIASDGKSYLEIPNKPGKQISLKIYIGISNNYRIGKSQAKNGLKIYGEELVLESKKNPGMHPAIDLLDNINSKKIKNITIKIIRIGEKSLPFTKPQIETLIKKHPTPFHIYDEENIRLTARKLYKEFEWAPGFKNYFAVKALPNPHILKILKEEGMGADCSSLPELMLAEAVGLKGDNIMFSSNETPIAEYKYAKKLNSIINLDDITHIEYLEKNTKLPELLCFRYNPGPLRKGNRLIGDPKEAKFGLTKKQIFQACKTAKKKGVKRFGLHTMIVSNELNPEVLIETGRMMFDLVVEINKKIGVKIEFVNLGGGYGIPYKPEEAEIDISYVSSEIKKAYSNKIIKNKLDPLKIIMECGRLVTGPSGFLITTAIHEKNTYKNYIGVDACMTNLMRPGMLGAYHHITVMDKKSKKKNMTYDIVGSLCINYDKFAIDRKLPEIKNGDIIVIHDTGAHGHSAGFQYNSKLRSAELLLKPDGSVKLIRRKETVDDYFNTLDFPGI